LAALLVGLSAMAINASEPVRIPLWASGAPGEPATKPEDEPVLFVHRPVADVATRTAIVVFPGGGYGHLAMDHEGAQIAAWLNSLGVTAFVLKYRNNESGHMHPVPMMDGQRAIRTVRARSGEWDIDPARIGVLGFSAGGHLASTLATHFDAGDANASDAVDRASSRPDFLVMCYPVITMTEKYMHRGSHDNLIGKSPDEALARSLSNDLQVTPETPPTFIFQTNEDKTVPAENCVSFYLARGGRACWMCISVNGPHGIGLGTHSGTTTGRTLPEWLQPGAAGAVDEW
jgi:acetyl esterase/lipase